MTPTDCDILDHDEQCDEEIEEFQDTDSPSAEAGSPGENTCYIDGVEQPNCDQFAHETGIHDDIPVTKDNEFPDKAGSDSGPKSMNQNDDPTDDRDPGNFGEKTYERDNTGSFAFEAGTVNGSDYLGSVSDLDLRGQTMPDTNQVGDEIYSQLRARRITDEEADILMKNMRDNLSGDCLGYIYALQEQVARNMKGKVAHLYDLQGLFDATNKSRGVNSGADQSGIWLYLEPSPGATAHSDWEKGNLSVALPASNGSALQRANYLTSEKALSSLVHELIHNSVMPMGGGDSDLARAALQLSGQTLDLSSATDKELAASNVWDDRLSRSCGWQGRVGLEKYIK